MEAESRGMLEAAQALKEKEAKEEEDRKDRIERVINFYFTTS